MSVKWIPARVTNPSPSHSQFQENEMSIQKMSLHDALARVGNPRLRRGGAKLSASARDLIDAGLGRASNPRKKKKTSTKKAKTAYKAKVKSSAKKAKSKSKSKSKSKAKGGRPKAGSKQAREMMARVRAGMSPTGGKKKAKSKSKNKGKSSRAKNPAARELCGLVILHAVPLAQNVNDLGRVIGNDWTHADSLCNSQDSRIKLPL